MAWVEIMKTDTAGIADFVALQQSCSDYYARAFDVAKATAYFDRPTHTTMRAFIWRDVDYELNLAVMLKNPTTLQLKVVGIRHFANINTAVQMFLLKVKSLLTEYGVKKLYAIWSDDVLPDTLSFYQKITNGFSAGGFVGTVVTNPKPSVFVINSGVL